MSCCKIKYQKVQLGQSRLMTQLSLLPTSEQQQQQQQNSTTLQMNITVMFPAGLIHNYHSYLHLQFPSFPIADRAFILSGPKLSHRASGLFSMQHLSGSIIGISEERKRRSTHYSVPMLSSTGTPSLNTALLMVLNNSI